MKIKQLATLTLTLCFAVSAHAEDTHEIAKAKLEKILICENDTSPEEVVSLIHTLGGLPILKSTNLADAEYTIPDPVDVFTRPVTKISIHRGRNADGEYTEYGSLFTGEPVDTIAKFAGITPDAAGHYRKEISGRDLLLRPEAGVTYIACVNDVRSIVKTIKRTAKNVGNKAGKITGGK